MHKNTMIAHVYAAFIQVHLGQGSKWTEGGQREHEVKC